MQITDEQRNKVLEIISHGLISGLGRPEPGRLCVEAAVCLALGEPHSDRPMCVAAPDRAYALRINDFPWSSPAARAEALAPLAVAQLGTAGTDRTLWAQAVALGTIQRVLPIALDAIGLRDHAAACRAVRTLDAAYAAANAAANAAAAATYAAATAAAYAAVASAAYAAAYAAACAMTDAAYAMTDAAYAAANATAYAARAVAAVAARAVAADASDSVLRESIAVALDAYRTAR